MILRTVNPYTLIGTQHTAGLDNLATLWGGTGAPTTSTYATEIAKYVGGIYYPPLPLATKLNMQLVSTVGHALNEYSNSMIKSNAISYSRNLDQMFYVNKLLKDVLKSPINEISDVITDIEDNVTKSDLSFEDQIPLLIAAEIGRVTVAYWIPKISTPGSWAVFFDTNAAINTINIPYWVSASMEGALLMANRSAQYPLMEGSTTPNAGVDLASALTGSIAVGGGKVIYRIIKRMTNPNGRGMGIEGCNC